MSSRESLNNEFFAPRHDSLKNRSQISSMLAFKCIQHAQHVRKIQYVAQEATGSASQYILRRSLGDTPCVSCVVKYADWISPSSSFRPFQTAQCEQIVGRVDKIEAFGTLEHTFKVASIYCAFYRSETLNVLSQNQALQLYAMYQQAVLGNAKEERAPSMSQIVRRAQFNAWRKVRQCWSAVSSQDKHRSVQTRNSPWNTGMWYAKEKCNERVCQNCAFFTAVLYRYHDASQAQT